MPQTTDDAAKRQAAKAEADRRIAAGDFTSQEQVDAFMASQGITKKQDTPAPAPRPATPAPAAPPTIGVGGQVVGAVRAAMNALTMGNYPRMVGAATKMFGGDGDAEAKKLAEYMATFKQESPTANTVGKVAGEIAPYVASGGILGGAGAMAGRVPALAKAMQTGAKGYAAARASVPLASKLLPASARAAVEVAGIEGARGASQAEDGESRVRSALKSAAMALPFGRMGEVAGTYATGKFGTSIDKMAARANADAQKAGEIMNQWRELGTLPVSPALAKLYQRSKPLREAVDEAAQALGLPSTDPSVLTEAYSKLTAEGSPVFKKTILTPFLAAIDEAAAPLVGNAKVKPLSEGIRKYAEAMKVSEAITQGRLTGSYLRTGNGAPEQVGGEVLAERLSRPYVNNTERQAAAQALIASIRQQRTAIPQTLVGAASDAARTALGGPRGVGEIADLAARLGGGSKGQKVMQRAGMSFGASR